MKHQSGKQYIYESGWNYHLRLVTLTQDLGKESLVRFHDKSAGLVETKDLIREATLKDLLIVDKHGYIPTPKNFGVVGSQIKIIIKNKPFYIPFIPFYTT